MKKVLRNDLILEACGDHKNGCYIRFRKLKPEEKVHHTKARGNDSDVIIDYDKNNKMIGIEFYDGL